MFTKLKLAASMFGLLSLCTLPALAQGDVAAGEKVFKKCAACHTVEADGPKRAGPSLYGVIGRSFGAVEGFAYSNAMKEAAAAGRTWTQEELTAFLENPKKALAGTKMAFAGLRKPQERDDIYAYLLSVQGEAKGEAAPAIDSGIAPVGDQVAPEVN